MKGTIVPRGDEWFTAEQPEPAMKNSVPRESVGENGGQESPQLASLTPPCSTAYDNLPKFPRHGVLPFRLTIHRQELRQMLPLADTTIYKMEHRGEFPRRFNLTPRYAARGMAEGEGLDRRTQASPARLRHDARCPPAKNPPGSDGIRPEMMLTTASSHKSVQAFGRQT